MTDQTTMREKIEKLLAKAERTDNPHEAEAFTKKAEALMAAWGIEAAMLDASRTAGEREQVTESGLDFTGTYAKGMTLFAHLIAEGLGLTGYEQVWRGKAHRRYIVVGHTSDVERAHLLITSMQLQAQTALRAWWRDYDLKAYLSPAEKFQARRQFLVSFATAVKERLVEQREEKKREAETQRAAATGTGPAAGPSVALVLADRALAVQQHMAAKRLGNARSMTGSVHGGDEGAAAGRAANLGDRSQVGGRARAALSA